METNWDNEHDRLERVYQNEIVESERYQREQAIQAAYAALNDLLCEDLDRDLKAQVEDLRKKLETL